jgi:serine/threonine protein kinase
LPNFLAIIAVVGLAGFSLLDLGTFEPGCKLDDRVELVELIGRGAMGSVYKAHQQGMERDVAVKALHMSALSDMDQVARFFREAKVVSTLDHPNIVKVFAVGLADERQPYMVMDYIQGVTLADLIAENSLKGDEYVDIFSQVASALSHAHRRDIVHRDIKPRNILIQRDANEKYIVKLVDFGIARYAIPDTVPGQKLTRTGAIIGSPTYMSPEQCTGRVVDLRTDLYSLGCVMYEAATGEVPFRHDDALGLITKHLMEPAPAVEGHIRVPGLSKSIARIISVLLNKNPEDRYENADALCADLLALKEGAAPPFASSASTSFAKITLPQHKNSKPTVTAIVVATTLLIGIFFIVRAVRIQIDRAPEPAAAARTTIDRLITHVGHLALTHRFADALSVYSSAYDLCRENGLKENSPIFADVCAGRARCEAETGALAPAAKYYAIATAYFTVYDSGNKRRFAELSMDWGKVELKLHHYSTAEALLRDAWNAYQKDVPMNLEGKISLLETYCMALDRGGKVYTSVTLYPTLIHMQETFGTMVDSRAIVHDRFAEALELTNNFAEAKRQRKLAKECRGQQQNREDEILGKYAARG